MFKLDLTRRIKSSLHQQKHFNKQYSLLLQQFRLKYNELVIVWQKWYQTRLPWTENMNAYRLVTVQVSTVA